MPASKRRKVVSLIVISLLGVIVGVAISLYLLLWLSVPPHDGRYVMDGVDNEVEITFDSMGVCQIWAETETDACFALGFQHAADRMFQMDVSRRLAGGRLSELLGSMTVDLDTDQRRIGHHRLARRALETLSDENRARLQAYCDGVNAYATYCRALPFEYRFLPVKFDPWTIEDCLTLLSFQTWFSNALMSRDEFYLDLEKQVGKEKAASLRIPWPEWAPTTVWGKYTAGIETHDRPLGSILRRFDDARYGSTDIVRRSMARAMLGSDGLPLHMSNSSNAWVVGPSKSASGKAMLASDPHLELTRLPQFWYVAGVHIRQDSVDVLGISTPGLPFFIMGHNGKAAWAFTAGGVKVTRFIEYKINPEDTNQYRTGEAWVDFETIRDSFYVSDIDSFYQVTFRQTVHGPVTDSKSDDTVLAFHWAGYDADLNNAVTNGFALHGVQSYEQFQKVVTGLGALDANMMYADDAGNIGYQLTTPMITPGDKRPAPEYIDSDQTPHVLNPERGWIASCNNLPQRSGYVRGHFFANRILSITELLQSRDTFSGDDMRRFQMDRHDRYWLRFTGDAAAVLDSIGRTAEANMLRAWDGSARTDSKETPLMAVYLQQLKRLTFGDELGSLHHQVPARWIEARKQIEAAGWFDDISTDETVETYYDIATKAMDTAIKSTDGVTWGEIHTLTMQHPLAMIPLLGDWLGLSHGPEPWGGTAGTLCASFNAAVDEQRFEAIAGPSWRFVIDFANIDSVTMVLPAGNSGNPMSDHFFDFNPLWKDGRYWVVPFSYNAVKQRATATLTFVPREEPQ